MQDFQRSNYRSEDNIILQCPDYYSNQATDGCFEVKLKYHGYFQGLTTVRYHFITAHKAIWKGKGGSSGDPLIGVAMLARIQNRMNCV